jgi:hypothetical protein
MAEIEEEPPAWQNIPAMQAFEEARTDIEAARKFIEGAIERLHQAVLSLGAQVGDDTALQEEIIKYIYWVSNDVHTAWLGETFSLTVWKVSRIAQVESPFRCGRCGGVLVATSKARLKKLESESSNLLCDDCWRAKYTCEGTYDLEAMQAAANARLKALQTMPYREYLQTPEWQEKRKQKLRSARYRCQVCNTGKTELNVHHRTYERRGNEHLNDLIVLCKDCHSLFHQQGKIVEE